MRTPHRLAVILPLLTPGCSTYSLPKSPPDGLFHFSATSYGADFQFALVPAAVDEHGPVMTGNVGRCIVIQDEDGRSRLVPTDHTPAVELTGRGFHLPKAPAGIIGSFVTAIIDVPMYMRQPFAALPNRLVDAIDQPGPVSADLIDLAHDFVDYKGVPITGTLAGTGVYICQMTLTDLSRFRLRAALDRHERAATRPSPTTRE